MVISDFAIKRPVITVVSMLALVVGGLIALAKLKLDEFPDVAPPYVSVAIPYPGASPDIVEKEVLDPIEEQIAGISGVKTVNGAAQDGFALITIEFQFDKPLAEATQDIRDAISEVRSDLPAEMEEPIIKKLNDTDRPIVSLALHSDRLTAAELTRVADPTVTRELRSLPGVAEVTVSGKQERELTVELRPADLQAYGVSVAQVVGALQSQSLAAPVGRVEGRYDERSIRLRGRLETPQEFANLVVGQRGGTLIRLGQVADVRDGVEEQRTLALYNGREAVGIDVKKSQGYSTTDVAERVLARVRELQPTLPEGVTVEVVKNSGTRVEAAVRNVKESLVEGAVLTVLVVFLFLNSWRSTVITGLALPVSAMAAFIAIWAFGFKLETMSLLGLSLAIGILIDDAIVVRENIVRHVEMGKDHMTAAHEGTDEIGLAVAATTFSILAVFVPIGFMGGIGGQWFKPFALTIACAVLISLFVSFSLDPMLSAYWSDPHVPEERKWWITRQLDRFNAWFNRLAEGYKRVIAWALDHRVAMVMIATGMFFASFTLPATGFIGLAVALLGTALAVWVTGTPLPAWVRIPLAAVVLLGGVSVGMRMPELRKVGVGFVPEDDRSEMNIQVESPPGANLEYLRSKMVELDQVVRRHPEALYTYATLGDPTAGSVDKGLLYVKMTPKNERDRSAEQLAALIRDEVEHMAGVQVAVFTSDIGGGRKQLMLQVKGPDLASINTAAEQIREQVAGVPGAVDLSLSSKGQRPELNVDVDRGLAGSLGISIGAVAQALRPAFAGIDVGDWVDPSGETRDVRIRLNPEARRRAEDLRVLPLVITAPDGRPATIPLGQVARVSSGLGPAVINHLDRDRVVNVEYNAQGRATGDVQADVLARVRTLQLPAGVTFSEGGDAKNQNEVFGNIFLALGVAVLLMYLILVMQFGSFLDPLAILMSLPLSLIGVMLALAIRGMTINIMSLIGVILLMGIVAKNAILLIDFAKWEHEKGMPLREALIHAGATRLRPILMTTFALIAGMVPVALGRGEGAQFRAPLGVAVIGGVITSTLLTLLVIPTIYEIFIDWRGGLMRLARRLFGKGEVAGAVPAAAHSPDAR
ncbi:MAG TPA: efflux RND transporter permease subunit [Gemmatimonadales bacterium]|nr:efflux RND transporter permease subunit [Gemmatimonadales bacterium]